VVDSHPIAVRVSIGVAVHRRGADALELVRRADQALYAARRGGRNRVEVAA
jgi:diguanylate cyclase (GGDEF)-like protein